MSIPTHKLKTLASALLPSSFFGQPPAALAATDEADATDDTPTDLPLASRRNYALSIGFC